MTADLSQRSGCDATLEEIVAGYLERLAAGQAEDRKEFLARHGEFAKELQEFFAARDQIDGVAVPLRLATLGPSIPGVSGADESGRVGDFRIVREVGRGGMGIVYEAEQVSLGRRVALKVLPFAATMDPRHLQRFQNEARAAASLHHPHIVPVHAVGVERGVHYYAMQLIDGRTLADLLTEMRCQERPHPGLKSPTPAPAWLREPVLAEAQESGAAPSPGSTATVPQQATQVGSRPGPRDAAYHRRVAEWGIQAAEALEHAHSVGIVHRDIKPANLLIDGQGQLWVTDFGLARMATDSGLTLTGDVLGSLRYMSPEQALARHGVVDHRTDLYALGVTLYELLTLRPAIDGADRQEILHRIAFEEPPSVRTIDRSVPQDLETIVQKASAKDAVDRYVTAAEMAADLGRYLTHKPIQARRTSLVQRARKWARRNQPIVWSAAIIALVLVGSVGWLIGDRTARRSEAERQVRQSLAVLEAGLKQGNPHAVELVEATRQLEVELRSGLVSKQLQQQAERFQADWAMLRRLETIRLGLAILERGEVDHGEFDRAYVQAFQEYGIDPDTPDTATAAERIQDRLIAGHVIVALDSWAALRREAKLEEDAWKRLLAVARLADRDTWRRQLRQAWEQKDAEELVKVASTASVEELPASTLYLLGHSLRQLGKVEQAVVLMRKAQRKHLDDFWLTYELGLALDNSPAQSGNTYGHHDEAIRFDTAALALRPRSPAVHSSLGFALMHRNRYPEAIDAFQEAIRLDPNLARAHRGLGMTLQLQGKYPEAIRALQEAIRLDPDLNYVYENLAAAFEKNGQVDQEIATYRERLRRQPDDARICFNLGLTLLNIKGKQDEAIGWLRKAADLMPGPNQYGALAFALNQCKRYEEAIAAYEEALRLKANDHRALANLSELLRDTPDTRLRDYNRAVELGRRAVEAAPDDAQIRRNLGLAQFAAGEWEGAVEALREVMRLQKGKIHPSDSFRLAISYGHLGQKEEARKWYDGAVQWMEKHSPQDAELIRFRAEAAELLDLNLVPSSQPTPPGKKP